MLGVLDNNIFYRSIFINVNQNFVSFFLFFKLPIIEVFLKKIRKKLNLLKPITPVLHKYSQNIT